MQRRNPATSTAHRFFLTLYWLVSGYGERYLRPLVWAGMLLVASALGYLALGLQQRDGAAPLQVTSPSDWLHAIHYSFRVMTLLRPDDLVATGWAKVIHTVQSLLGPLLLGLFALALRQRLKR